jgi:hypothetical protein
MLGPKRFSAPRRSLLRGDALDGFGQASKGKWWMPWRQEAMKDVDGCDKPRGAATQALIRGCPNGETRQGSCPAIPR